MTPKKLSEAKVNQIFLRKHPNLSEELNSNNDGNNNNNTFYLQLNDVIVYTERVKLINSN